MRAAEMLKLTREHGIWTQEVSTIFRNPKTQNPKPQTLKGIRTQEVA
jgi:hypothetical protein